MRQIKFRAKNTNDEWVYGSLIINETENDKGKFQVAFIVPGLPCASDGGDFYTARMERVKVETIGQFTGLTDIDGREIYEGDVLHFDELNYRMTWIDNMGEFAALKIEHSMLNPPVNYCVVSFWCKKELKIIGNIYDSSELIAEDMNIQIKED